MGWIEHDHADAPALVTQVAAALEACCREAIAERGMAFLALAGGRTPLPIYTHLAASGLGGRVLALPGDERCVPHAHPACNLRNLRAAFAADPAIEVHSLTASDGAIDASLAQARDVLATHPQAFDAVLLGMGADGHFASLFPGARNLAEGLDPAGRDDAIGVLPDPLPSEAPFARISLTLPRLLRARQIHLVVTGEDKRRVLRSAQQQDSGSGLPIAALLHARAQTPVRIHWSP
jgi:6-phosphogluconolactonase